MMMMMIKTVAVIVFSSSNNLLLYSRCRGLLHCILIIMIRLVEEIGNRTTNITGDPK